MDRAIPLGSAVHDHLPKELTALFRSLAVLPSPFLGSPGDDTLPLYSTVNVMVAIETLLRFFLEHPAISQELCAEPHRLFRERLSMLFGIELHESSASSSHPPWTCSLPQAMWSPVASRRRLARDMKAALDGLGYPQSLNDIIRLTEEKEQQVAGTKDADENGATRGDGLEGGETAEEIPEKESEGEGAGHIDEAAGGEQDGGIGTASDAAQTTGAGDLNDDERKGDERSAITTASDLDARSGTRPWGAAEREGVTTTQTASDGDLGKDDEVGQNGNPFSYGPDVDFDQQDYGFPPSPTLLDNPFDIPSTSPQAPLDASHPQPPIIAPSSTIYPQSDAVATTTTRNTASCTACTAAKVPCDGSVHPPTRCSRCAASVKKEACRYQELVDWEYRRKRAGGLALRLSTAVVLDMEAFLGRTMSAQREVVVKLFYFVMLNRLDVNAPSAGDAGDGEAEGPAQEEDIDRMLRFDAITAGSRRAQWTQVVKRIEECKKVLTETAGERFGTGGR